MRDELQKKLADEYPFMRRKPLKNPNYIDDLYSAFGISAGDGWYQLLWDLCSEITEAYKEAGKEPDIQIDQIKEKYGTLRFYYSFDGEPWEVHAIDVLGDTGLGAMRLMPEGEGNALKQKIADIVRKYEKQSGTVCEMCGKLGKLRTDRMWIRTLCDACNENPNSYR